MTSAPAWSFTRGKPDGYGVNAKTAPAVNLYHPVSNLSIGGLDRNGRTPTARPIPSVMGLDTLTLTERIINGAASSTITIPNMTAPPPGRQRTGLSPPARTVDRQPVTTVDTAKSGNLVNWKAGALYRLTGAGQCLRQLRHPQQPPEAGNFALAASGSGNSANRPTLSRRRRNPASWAPWQIFDNRLLLSAALFRTDIENEVAANDDGTLVAVRQKRVEGYELSATGNLTPDWTIIAGYTQQHATVTEGQNVAQDGSSALAYTPKHAFTLWTQYQATSDLSVGGGVRYVGSLRRGSDGAVGTPDHTEGYWVADAKLGYRVNSNLDLQLNMYNLFDTDYVASINKSGYRYHPGEPRTFMLTANVHF